MALDLQVRPKRRRLPSGRVSLTLAPPIRQIAAPVVSALLPAIQCPAPVGGQRSGFLSVLQATLAAQGNAPTGSNVVVDAINFVRNTLRPNLTAFCNLARYGGGGAYASALGLAITAIGALTVKVEAGHALMDGIVELAQDTTLSIPDAGDGVYWIWLKRTGTFGTLLVIYGSLAPPSTPAVCIGNVQVVSHAIVAVDYSGVLFVNGGRLERQTADAGAPTDTPPTYLRFHTVTQAGTYHWDGNSHNQVATAPFPLGVQYGGTGAITAAAARANLGVSMGGTLTPIRTTLNHAGSPYTLTAQPEEAWYFCDCSGGAISVTLPQVSTAQFRIVFVKIDPSGNHVNLTPHAGDTIESGITTLSTATDTVSWIPDGGTMWWYPH